ncbi:MAG TPA: lantibiotic dehydratase C-terminal domain-containing protein, partial [Gemmatimonadales bacterium]|nr:lantibiotic dehydratase C-terminal domain-containing protein [Gemmatimonadales bacterium]
MAQTVIDSVLSRWQAYHFYYHDRQDLLLENLLRPLFITLLKQREIDSFFFVRSQLGGPHVRLRLRLRVHMLSNEVAVADALEEAAGPFFQASPSRVALADEEIRKINQGILQSDPSEMDDAIYPDNSVWAAPFRPEVDRYGGPRLFLESLAFFTVSSCEVLDFLHQQAGNPGARLLPFAFHLLGRQALGLAR